MCEEIGIKSLRGVCCPDSACIYGYWNTKTCSACGANCEACEAKIKSK